MEPSVKFPIPERRNSNGTLVILIFSGTKLIIFVVNLFCRERGCLGLLLFAIFQVPRDSSSNVLRSFSTAWFSSPQSMRSLLQNLQPCSLPWASTFPPGMTQTLIFFPPLTSLKAATLPLITQHSSQLRTNHPKSH